MSSLLGVGIYSVPEAARLTGVSAQRIRRWLQGYEFRSAGETRRSPAVWTPDLPTIGGVLALSFRDLMEVRFVNAFLERGVSWKTLRAAEAAAAEAVQSTHPFSTKKFKTYGRTVLYEFATSSGEKRLLELVEDQYNIPAVVGPYLYSGVIFSQGRAAKWFPLPGSQRVVLDPERSFGQPIVVPESVPTNVLARAFRAEGSIERVARWFVVDPQSVQDAVEYETKLAA